MIANIISIYVIIGLLLVIAILVCTLTDDSHIHDFIVRHYDVYGGQIVLLWIAAFVGMALVWPVVLIVLLSTLAKNR